jgi:N-acetylmuramoyl-L-alanine amidase
MRTGGAVPAAPPPRARLLAAALVLLLPLAAAHEPARAGAVLDPNRPAGPVAAPPLAGDGPRHRLAGDFVPTAITGGSLLLPGQAGGKPDLVVPAVPRGGRSAGDPWPLVVVDPGHGGADSGAVAVDGSFEKNLVLAAALELRRLLERAGRYRVALTRDGDSFLRLPERLARARALGGQLLVSLHADSLPAADRRGAAVYTLAEEAAPAAARVARRPGRDGKADAQGGPSPPGHGAVLAALGLDPARRGSTQHRSAAFADLVAEELGGVTPMLHRRRRSAGFAVLRSPDIPSILLELGCLSNGDDARALGQAGHRAELARAILRALDRYFAVPPT